MIDESKIAERYRALGPELNERQRRLWAASEARSHGRGGIAAVVRATGISKNTVVRGIAEVREGARLDGGRGGGGGLGWGGGPGGGGGAAAVDGVRFGAGGGAGGVGRSGDARGSGVAVAVVLEELAEDRERVGGCRSSDLCPLGGEAVAGAWVSVARERQDEGGERSSRPRCAVRAYQRDRPSGARGGRADDLYRCQEARAGRGFQEQRA